MKAPKLSTKTKLTNIATGDVIVLSDGLYPVDEHDWSPVVSSSNRTLTGVLVTQQFIRVAGQPITLQSPQDMGWLTRETVDKLKAERDKIETEFWLDCLEHKNGSEYKRYKVIFDHSQTPLEAKPVFNRVSPLPTDPFLVTLRFLTAE